LTDILSWLTCISVMVAVLKLWRPARIMRLAGDQPAGHVPGRYSAGEILVAWSPYLLLVVFVLAVGAPSIKNAIDARTHAMLPSMFPKSPPVMTRLFLPCLHN